MRIVDPEGALACADRCDKRASIGIEMNPFFLGGAEGDLLGRSFGEALAPRVDPVASVGGEIHPLPVGGPGGIHTLRRRRADRLAKRATIEGC